MLDAPYAVIVAAGLCLAVFVRNRLDRAAQPCRLDMAELGERLLGSPHLNAHVKESVRFCLDHAFGARGMLIGQICFVPFYALIVLFKMQWVRHVSIEYRVEDKEARADIADFFALYDRVAWINNPFLMLVLTVAFHLLVGLAVLVRATLLNGVPKVDLWTIKPALEEVMSRFASKIPIALHSG
jgi:hypothetical protein